MAIEAIVQSGLWRSKHFKKKVWKECIFLRFSPRQKKVDPKSICLFSNNCFPISYRSVCFLQFWQLLFLQSNFNKQFVTYIIFNGPLSLHLNWGILLLHLLYNYLNMTFVAFLLQPNEHSIWFFVVNMFTTITTQSQVL